MSGPLGMGPYLYIPVEVASRELDAKLLLAARAIRRGFEVVFGQKWLMLDNLAHVPPGIVLFKTLTVLDAKAMERAVRCGHEVAAIDEEMPGLVARKQGLRYVADAALKCCRIAFTVGPDHQQTMEAMFPAYRSLCRPVGNPRWDLLRPEFRGFYREQVAEIRREHAPFILINTNFAFLNGISGSPESMIRSHIRSGKLDPDDPADMAYIEQCRLVEQANIDIVRQLLRTLPQRFPGHRLILRPHPAEKSQTWLDFVADIPNAAVIGGGSAIPWILASDALLHTNCTTGVEAFSLGKPAVCLQPAASPILEMYLSGKVNFVERTPSAACDRLSSLLAAGADSFRYPESFNRAFDQNFGARTGALSADLILDALIEVCALRPDPAAKRASWTPGRGYAWRTRMNKRRKGVMPKLEDGAIEARLARLGQALGESALAITVRDCGDNVFHLHGCETDVPIPAPRRGHDWPLRWLWNGAGRSRHP